MADNARPHETRDVNARAVLVFEIKLVGVEGTATQLGPAAPPG